MEFPDVVAAGDTLVALATDGIYPWTPPTSTLPNTGTNTRLLLSLSLLLTTMGSLILATTNRLTPRRL